MENRFAHYSDEALLEAVAHINVDPCDPSQDAMAEALSELTARYTRVRGPLANRISENHCNHSAGFRQFEGDLRCRTCDINQDNIMTLPRPESLKGHLTRPAWIDALGESIAAGADELVKSCAQAISERDRVTPRPLTAEDQARAVLEYFANTKPSNSGQESTK